MLVKTKFFGDIDLDKDKIITFENGIMGFEHNKNYTILYDIEDGKEATILWFQSLEEKDLAIPIINPFYIKEDYNPEVDKEVLKLLGAFNEENLAVFLVMTVPEEIKKTTVNLKAPLIINMDTKKGCQVVVENPEYIIKYNVYDEIKKLKKEKGV